MESRPTRGAAMAWTDGRVRRAEQGVPGQGGRVGVDGGADVEQHQPAGDGGQHGGEGGPADAGPAAEAEGGGA